MVTYTRDNGQKVLTGKPTERFLLAAGTVITAFSAYLGATEVYEAIQSLPSVEAVHHGLVALVSAAPAYVGITAFRTGRDVRRERLELEQTLGRELTGEDYRKMYESEQA